MANTQHVFVSHSHEDRAFCQLLVAALRKAGADVWYDEHDIGAGELLDVIQRELGQRKIFIIILSKHAFASLWARRETSWAYELAAHDPTRIILPVTASAIAQSDFSPEAGWLFLNGFRRIEAPGYQPYPYAEAIRRTLDTLSLTTSEDWGRQPGSDMSANVSNLMSNGKTLREQGKRVDALALFEHATQLDPSCITAWFNLGELLNQLGRYEEALAAWDHASGLSPDVEIFWHSKGASLNHLNRYSEALAAFERALSLNSKDARAWCGRSRALYNTHAYGAALSSAEQAFALDPSSLIVQDNLRLAVEGANTKKVADCERALAVRPDDATIWIRKAQALFQPAESIVAYEQALALAPFDLDAWIGLATRYLQLREYEMALHAYEKAMTIDSGNAKIWLAAGWVLDQWDQFEEIMERADPAYESTFDGFEYEDYVEYWDNVKKRPRKGQPYYDKAFALDPALPAACNSEGLLLYKKRRYEEAVVAFEQAIVLDPTYTDAWKNKGNALYCDHEKGKALAAYEHALTLDPLCVEAWRGKAKIRSAEAQAIHQEALAVFAGILNVDPTNSVAWLGRGNALSELRRWSGARDAYDRALTFNPTDSRIWVGKGAVLRLSKHYFEGLSAYEEAIALNTEDEQGWLGKARTLSDLGRCEEALIALDQAIALVHMDAWVWHIKSQALSALGRYVDADEAELRFRIQQKWDSRPKFGTIDSLSEVAPLFEDPWTH